MLAITFFIALGILELGLFVVGPALQNGVSPAAGNAFYIVLRLVTILGFSFVCVRKHKRSFYGALSMTGFLLFLDQVVFKSLWLVHEIKKNPAAWEGIDPKSAVYNSAFSYIVSLPIILLLAFLGALLALRRRSI